MNPGICAVVATHDRLPLLQQCIAALRGQTRRLDDIIVIDNASAAETVEWLDTQTDLQVVHQANLGCGGGIATGLQVAVARGHDWIWCFDEDAHPAPDALQVLEQASHNYIDVRVFNSLGVALESPSRFPAGAICLRTNPADYKQGQYLYSVAELKKAANNSELADTVGGQFYYGTLVHRSVVQAVGVPLAWLFFRGDEIEYGLRIMRAGYHIYSVPGSIVTHPLAPITYLELFGRKFPCERMSALKRYYSIRNSIYIRRLYYREDPFWFYVARRVGAAMFVELFIDRARASRAKRDGCLAILRGLRDGLALLREADFSAKPIGEPAKI